MKYPGLVIEEDMNYQRRHWRLERIGWVCMALITLAALLGLLGGRGPLSHTLATAPQAPIQIEHLRFARQQTPQFMAIHFLPHAPTDGDVRLWLSAAFLDAMEIESITPQPLRSEISESGLWMTFSVNDLSGRASAHFTIAPRQIGSLRGRIGAGPAEAVDFHQFVYP